VTVAWDFGDGTTAAEPFGVAVSHSYVEPGDHTVTAEAIGHNAGAATVTARSRNLLVSDDQASFEGAALAGWTGNNATVAVTDERAAHGQYSLLVTITGASPASADARVSVTNPGVDIDGRLLTFIASLWVPYAGRSGRLTVGYLDATGTQFGSAQQLTNQTLAANQWTQLRADLVMREGSVGFLLRLVVAGGVTGDLFYADRVGVFLGAVQSPDWALPSATPA